MGIRNGAEVLAGLRDGRAIYIDGERVADVTRDARFAGAARTLAGLYDLQGDPKLRDEMTYVSPTTGARVGLSFIEPRTQDDLRRRRVMIKHWHDWTLGMFGRAPDFLNVVISTYASCAEAFGPQFAPNVRAYYERAREGDLIATHSLANPQVDRSTRNVVEQPKDLAARAVADNDKGIVIRGARMLATLAAFSDELMVMPPPSGRLPDTEAAKPFAIGFAVPIATPGLRFICRPGLAPRDAGSSLDHPLSSRYDESDGMVIFDDVLVPWERVFIYRDVDICNTLHRRTDAFGPSAQQYVIKDLAKAEFMMALAFALAHTTKVDEFQHIQGSLAELINHTEVIRSCVLASELEATSRFGILMPAAGPLDAMRFMFPQMFRRACEIIQIVGAGGLFMVPSHAELDGPLAADVETFYQAANADSRRRIGLFRLAFDAALSSFSGRQQLYERYFAGDPVRAAGGLYHGFDKDAYIARVWAILERFEKEGR